MESGAVLIFLITATLCAVRAEQAAPCSYPALFLFGDSLEDTGNGPYIGTTGATMLPYGETFPGWADLRFSDGRVVAADFLAKYLGLPPLNPSMNTTLDFSHGVNYAVPGATALSLVPYSLKAQIGWHFALREEVIASGDTPGRPSRAMFDEGLYILQIGGDDYFHYFWRMYSPQYVNVTIVPRVVQELRAAVERLYLNGARNFLIFGIPPLGCAPAVLANFTGARMDKHGCLLEYNEVCENHRVQLLREVQSLGESHPDGTFTFLDYLAAFFHVLENMESYGFNNAFNACCGAGPRSPYGYDVSILCGNHTHSLFLCSDPNTHFHWDGLHYTDRFNFQIFNQTILSRSYLYPYDGLVACASKFTGSGFLPPITQYL